MLSPEDKKDVKGAYGKAIANKISKVTNDSKMKHRVPGSTGRVHPLQKKLMEKSSSKYSNLSGDPAGDAEYGRGRSGPGRKSSIPSGVNYKAHGKGLSGAKN